MNRRRSHSRRNSTQSVRRSRITAASSHRKHDGVRWRRKRTRRIVFWLLTAVILVLAIFAVRNVYFFITEAKSDPDEPYPVEGVDVSSYQKKIDWQGLEDEGIEFAFIKATEGSTHIDSRFEYNWREAHKTGMKVGAYHFLSYDSKGSTQAENYIENVDKKWGMLPPVVDVEFYGKYVEDHPSKKKIYRILDVVLEELEDRYNKKPIIYTNTHIYSMYISERYDNYPIWISDPDITEKLPDGRDWVFCQYSFKGISQSVAKGEKYVDMNVFNGSRWEFRKYDGK